MIHHIEEVKQSEILRHQVEDSGACVWKNKKFTNVVKSKTSDLKTQIFRA